MATSTPTTVTSPVSYTLLDGEDNLILTGTDYIDGTGNSSNNQITGNLVDNTLDGLKGADTLLGGEGDDSYVVDDVNDVVIEYANTPQTVILSTDSNNKEASGESYGDTFSADGTKVLFSSLASNLVASDTNDVFDVFVKDLKTGEITRISTDASGKQANGESFGVVFSADGSKVLFRSAASNLVANDNNGKVDVFLKDLKTGEVTLVSSNGSAEGFNGSSVGIALSADGTKVLFDSDASNVVVGDTNTLTDAFVKDLTTGEITRVSTDSGNKEIQDSAVIAVGMSADGNKVLLHSASSNLVSGDNNDAHDVFVKDVKTGAVIRVSTDYEDTEANGNSEGYAISADGTKVLFASNADNLVGGDTNRASDVFVKNIKTGEVTRVSTDANGSEANGASFGSTFSADGTKVLFNSLASSLVLNDENGTQDVFVKDLTTGEILRVSNDDKGNAANGLSDGYELSADGRQILFTSDASNLVQNDSNRASDVFISTLAYNGGYDDVSSSVSYTLPTNVEELSLTGTNSLSGIGNESNNQIYGNSGSNTLSGGLGNDYLSGGIGADVIDGGAGNDYISAENGDDSLEGGQGDDTLIGENGNDTLSGSEGIDLLVGGMGNDSLLGGDGTDSLLGDDGNDYLDGGLSNDSMFGGAGDDTYIVDDYYDQVIELDVPQTMSRINLNALEQQGNSHSYSPIFSPDGSKIAFRSDASNLVDGDTNGTYDEFVKDLNTGIITRVSTAADGVEANGESYDPHFSPDGAKLIFASTASNLVADDTNGASDAFIKDLTTGAITRVSTDSTNNIQADFNSYSPIFSPDGTKVLFYSDATNLVVGDTNGAYDVFLKDLETGAVTQVSTDSNGVVGNAYSGDDPIFSPDGTKVAFYSDATNLVANDTNTVADVFVKDLITGSTTRFSVNDFGVEGNGTSYNPVFSPDGTKIMFVSYANNLVVNDTNGTRDIFIKDLTTGAVTRVSTDDFGVEGNGSHRSPVFSPDGKKLPFAATPVIWSQVTLTERMMSLSKT